MLAGCATAPSHRPPPAAAPATAPATAPAPRQPAAPQAQAQAPATPGNPPFYDVMGERYYVLPDSTGYSEQGVASWYGREFHGKRTSSGEIYDMYALTAAHKTLPLPTMARVTSLTTGKSVIVRVNDRGPFKKGRLIDLSYGAARELGFLAKGTDLVEVQALTPAQASRQQRPADVPAPARTMYAQVGAFSQRPNAEALRRRLESQGFENVVIRYDARSEPALYRVRVGPVANAAEFDEVVKRVTKLQVSEPQLVTESGEGDWSVPGSQLPGG